MLYFNRPGERSPPFRLLNWKPKGFIFGKRGSFYLAKPEEKDGHILVVGGAGTGKSSCLAIPSLISWQHSVFAIDIKGELLAKTGHQRPCRKVFNPLKPEACGFDPFYMLGQSRNLVQNVREIVIAIIQKPASVKDPFWIEGAQNLLSGAILHYYNLGFSFVETIRAMLTTPLPELIEEIHASQTEAAQFYINQFVGLDIKTVSGVYAELSNRIMLYVTDPDIKACLSKKETITPSDLENGMDIFLNVPEDKLEQWKPLLTLIINQFIKYFERRSESGARPILFLLDEFARLGKIEPICNALATLRSKKIVFCLLIQSLAQLDLLYGREARQVIADNCQYKAILGATDADTQEYFSRLVGTGERIRTSQSTSFDGEDSETVKSTGTHETTEEKRLIKPEDFATLRDIVMLSPFGYCRAKKTPYYKSRAFRPAFDG